MSIKVEMGPFLAWGGRKNCAEAGKMGGKLSLLIYKSDLTLNTYVEEKNPVG